MTNTRPKEISRGMAVGWQRQEAKDALDSNGALAGSESSWNVDLKRKGNGTSAAPI